MVNAEKVHALLASLESALKELRVIARLSQEQFLKNGLALGAAKYYLQTAIEACIDIGNHVIASEGYRSPRDYRDVFTVLEENGVLPGETAATLRQMAGLRNRLVHLYWEIDDSLIYEYLHTRLGDFEPYFAAIQRLLK